MQIAQIVALLKAERDRLSSAIDALEGSNRPVGARRSGAKAAPASHPRTPRRKRTLSEAGRRAIAEAAKKRWAALRASKAAASGSSSNGSPAAKKSRRRSKQ